MFGMIGIVEYIFPIVLALTLVFLVSNRDMLAVARVKSAAVYALMIVLAAAIMRVTDNPSISDSTLGEMFSSCADEKIGGGLLGGLLCKLMSPFGTVGTMAVLIILAIICIIIITERSFISGLKGLKSGSSRVIKEARQDYDIYREHAGERAAMKQAVEDEYATESEEEYLERRRREKELRNQERLKKEKELLIQKEQRAQERMQRKARGVTLDTELPRENVAPNSVDIREIISDVGKDIDTTDDYSKDIYEPDFTDDARSSGHVGRRKRVKEPDLVDLSGDVEADVAGGVSGNVGAVGADDIVEAASVENPNVGSFDRFGQVRDFGHNENAEKASAPSEKVGHDEPRDVADDGYNDVTGKTADMDKFVGADKSDVAGKMASMGQAAVAGKSVGNAAENNITAKTVNASPVEDDADDDDFEPATEQDKKKEYEFPPIELLNAGDGKKNVNLEMENRETAMRLTQTLQNFGVKVTVTDISCGPSVTRYELQPEQGVKVSKIVSLSDDIKLNLAAADIRIEAPIPGKAAIGIEVPNKEAKSVHFRELIETDEFKNAPSAIAFAAGKDIAGKTIVADIAKMPHLLIAGATGSGKSVCINTIIMSILYKAHPDDVKLIMVDPKVVELSVYNGIPHLLTPVVTDPKKASGALNWAVAEMTLRYKRFAEMNVRDLKGYNAKIDKMNVPEGTEKPAKMPQIVIIIDELADLMMVAPGEVEDAICRLAQLARAAGIHLIIATQRPSVNVITGIIKANIPSRIAFSVSSGVDSRTIIDMNGAEKLLGKGDMLFFPSGYPKPVRVQGAFVSDEEVGRVVDFLKANTAEQEVYDAEVTNSIASSMETATAEGGSGEAERDSLFEEAGHFVIEKEKGSIGMLQRYFKVGFNRAGRIMDQLADAGVVGPEEGTKPRKILMTKEEFEELLKR
jgi:S-DNA-T family DNA segregation ATPase FtsK/SpoIIIE